MTREGLAVRSQDPFLEEDEQAFAGATLGRISQ